MKESEGLFAVSLAKDPLEVLVVIPAEFLIQVDEDLCTQLPLMLNPNDVLAPARALVYRNVSVHELAAFRQLAILVPVLTDAATFDEL